MSTAHFADLPDYLPKLVMSDWQNCGHRIIQKRGFTKEGRQRVECAWCHCSFVIGPSPMSRRIEIVTRRLLEPGATVRSVAKETGATHRLIGKIRKQLGSARLGKCVCGKPAGHLGWCRYRVERSPSRQAFLAGWPRKHREFRNIKA